MVEPSLGLMDGNSPPEGWGIHSPQDAPELFLPIPSDSSIRAISMFGSAVSAGLKDEARSYRGEARRRVVIGLELHVLILPAVTRRVLTSRACATFREWVNRLCGPSWWCSGRCWFPGRTSKSLRSGLPSS